MKPQAVLPVLAAACLAALAATPASATASLGGTISLVGNSGNCNLSKQVPLTTLQDAFSLSASTGCGGTLASADMRGEAATGSVGVRGSSLGNGAGSSQASAQVGLLDHWVIGVPAGTPNGTRLTLPVTLTVEGTVSPGAVFSNFKQGFVEYNLSMADASTGVGGLSAQGFVTAAGSFAQTFRQDIGVNYFGAGAPATIEVSLILFVPGLWEGAVDFYNTASASISLPPGFTATTSSGIPLVFAPVPEPASGALLASGVLAVALARRKGRMRTRLT